MTDKTPMAYKILYAIYASYICAVFLQFSWIAGLVATVVTLAALIVSYDQRKKQAGTILESHHSWVIRTFWIGGAVYLPVITVLATGIMAVVSVPAIQAIADRGITDPERIQEIFLTEQGDKIMMIWLALMLPFAIWWLYRCGKGLRCLRQNIAVPNPNSWF